MSVMELATNLRCIVCTKNSPFGLTHASCKTTLTPDRSLNLYNYKSQSCSESIIAGKYSFISSVFNLFGTHLAKHMEMDISILNPEHVIVTPLPLHARRKRWRGYNQSEILATTFAQELSLPYRDTLVRTRHTKTQKDLGKDKREENIQNCFALVDGANILDKTILLIDDVTTTGSTLKEASKVLKRNGALTVWCIALAQD